MNSTQQPTKNKQARWRGDHTGCATWRGHEGSVIVSQQKIKKIKMIVALGSRQTMNSTQQPTKNKQARWRGDHTGCATWRGHEGSVIVSISGRSSWEEGKKWHNIDECRVYKLFFFLADLHNSKISFDSALDQSIAKRLQRWGG
jgi:hypothetical protein